MFFLPSTTWISPLQCNDMDIRLAKIDLDDILLRMMQRDDLGFRSPASTDLSRFCSNPFCLQSWSRTLEDRSDKHWSPTDETSLITRLQKHQKQLQTHISKTIYQQTNNRWQAKPGHFHNNPLKCSPGCPKQLQTVVTEWFGGVGTSLSEIKLSVTYRCKNSFDPQDQLKEVTISTRECKVESAS